MTLTSLGMVIELAGAGVASRVIVAMLFGVSALDPDHVCRRGRAAGGSVCDSLLGSRMASGAGRSGDYVARGVRSQRV